jgi:hypothetical protein
MGKNGKEWILLTSEISRPYEFEGAGGEQPETAGTGAQIMMGMAYMIDEGRPWKGLPMIKDRATMDIFQSVTSIRVGDGKKVYLWKDIWVFFLTNLALWLD